MECLERLGYVRRGKESLEQYLSFVANAPGFGGNRAVTLYGAGGSEIDLHWAVGESLPAVEILNRAVRAKLLGTEIPVTSPADGLFLSVRHAIRENLAAEAICRDLLDVSLWCEALRGGGELPGLLQRDTENRISVLAVTGILRCYDPAGTAAEAAEILGASASPMERRSAEKLVELFHHQLQTGKLSKDVFYLVHSRPWRQIVRGLRRDWSGYRQSMRSMEEALGAAEPWGARASRLAKSVPSLRGLRLARELAKAKYGMD
jgi:hypothetical protein